MADNYKIYYNDSFVLITADVSQSNKKFAKVISNQKEIEEFAANPAIFYDGITNVPVMILTNKPSEVLSIFLEHQEIILAGGGIVWNERKELLMIYRRGHWDLAKGKIEVKEKIIDGAVREVEEETGVKIKSVNENALHTYHAYKLKGRNCIKETSWYEMKAKEGQIKLVPQTEEDIEDVCWVKPTDLIKYKAGCYPLIWDLIEPFQS
jgi:8-oxo-dGTP pyrophosphatase MutT (NUDIX family)